MHILPKQNTTTYIMTDKESVSENSFLGEELNVVPEIEGYM